MCDIDRYFITFAFSKFEITANTNGHHLYMLSTRETTILKSSIRNKREIITQDVHVFNNNIHHKLQLHRYKHEIV